VRLNEICGASTVGILADGMPLGPCMLRANHDGPLHQDADGCQWTDPQPDQEGGPMPIKAPEFEAIDKKTGMTLDELASFVESARAANAPRDAVIEVTTVGFTHPRIKTAKVRAISK
jgi:hypothetical protein